MSHGGAALFSARLPFAQAPQAARHHWGFSYNWAITYYAMDIDIIAILTAVAFCAGFFDAIAGGGGLITVPALFLAGMDPVAALATNKFQASAGSVSATVAFARKGLVEWKTGRVLAAFSMMGGILGALFVSYMDKNWLEASIPVLLLLVAGYFAFAPRLDDDKRKKRMTLLMFAILVAPFIGFYDGVFGPGTGSFFMVGLTLLCGLPVMRAVSFTKLANAACNLGALFIFLLKGAIFWSLAISMAFGAFAGAQLGARCAVKVGTRLVRPMVVVVCCALAIKLLSSAENPLRMAISTLF